MSLEQQFEFESAKIATPQQTAKKHDGKYGSPLWEQILSMMTHFCCTYGVVLSLPLLSFWLLAHQWLRWPYLAYLVWLLRIDKTPETGGKQIHWLRRHWIWNGYKNYFPARTVLDFDKNEFIKKYGDLTVDHSSRGKAKQENKSNKKVFVLGIHPHGFICHSTVVNFVFQLGSSQLDFLGDFVVAAHNAHAKAPFFREVFMWLGGIPVASKSICAALDQGTSVGIVVGGLRESAATKPGNTVDDLVLNRKGFVKLALKNAADLIPSYSFGETELYQPLFDDSTKFNKLKQFFKRYLASVPQFKGRWGLPVPFRVPLFTVIGAPIPVPKIEEPSPEQIDHYHSVYVQALSDLYSKYQAEYDAYRKSFQADHGFNRSSL